MAFEVWVESVEASRDNKTKMTRVVSRMLKRSLVMAFEAWVESMEASRDNKTKMTRVVSKMLKRSLAMAFEVWVESVEARRDNKAKMTRVVSRVQAEQESKLKLYSDASFKVSSNSKSHECSLLEFELARISKRVKYLQLAQCWNRWRISSMSAQGERLVDRESELGRDSEDVRIAKAFFCWKSNLWWQREFMMHNKRMVTLIQVEICILVIMHPGSTSLTLHENVLYN